MNSGYLRQNRRAKYIKEKCCVCGKWGAAEPFDHGGVLRNLKAEAKRLDATLRSPESLGVHDKCLKQFKELLRMRGTNGCAHYV